MNKLCNYVSLQRFVTTGMVLESCCCPTPQSMTLPVQRKLVCAQVQLADLLITLMSEAEEEEQAERDRWQGLSSVDKVVKSAQCIKLTIFISIIVYQ